MVDDYTLYICAHVEPFMDGYRETDCFHTTPVQNFNAKTVVVLPVKCVIVSEQVGAG